MRFQNARAEKIAKPKIISQNSFPRRKMMILQEHHKTFAVKCFAHFMTRNEVVIAFMNEFPEDLPKSPTESNENLSANEQAKIDNHIAKELDQYKGFYLRTDFNRGIQKFKKDLPKLTEEIVKKYHEPRDKEIDEEHKRKVKRKISDQIRRYNIDHIEFPKKYKELFEQTRQEYVNHLLNIENENGDFLKKELQKMFAITEKQLCVEKDPNKILAIIRLKLQLLNTMVKQQYKE